MRETRTVEPTLHTAGGRIFCRRCDAKSKRTRRQCGGPAMRGKTKCRFHGGKSCRPTSERGRQLCALAKWQGKGESRRERVRARETSQTIRLLKHLWVLLESNPMESELSASPLVEAVLARVALAACDSARQAEPINKKVRSSP